MLEEQPIPNSTPRWTQAERRAETERKVLNAALRLIAEGGSRTMSLAAVGREAGYSRGIVTHQFGSRHVLLRRAAEYAQFEVPPPDPDAVGLERLLSLVDNYLEYILRPEPAGRAFLIMWVEAVASEPSLRPIFLERDAVFRTLIADIVAEGVAEGSIRPDATPAATAVIVAGQLRGVGLQLILNPDVAMRKQIQREAREVVRRALAASLLPGSLGPLR